MRLHINLANITTSKKTDINALAIRQYKSILYIRTKHIPALVQVQQHT